MGDGRKREEMCDVQQCPSSLRGGEKVKVLSQPIAYRTRLYPPYIPGMLSYMLKSPFEVILEDEMLLMHKANSCRSWTLEKHVRSSFKTWFLFLNPLRRSYNSVGPTETSNSGPTCEMRFVVFFLPSKSFPRARFVKKSAVVGTFPWVVLFPHADKLQEWKRNDVYLDFGLLKMSRGATR